ncbi:MAG: hypothetical protein K9L68_13700, partial [Spirochaetales bacterium]|nr:hypothetical protein [Spirochaetales bacterium]MCF7939646.1 hypothetical protein [Spirochaetales bacterium]
TTLNTPGLYPVLVTSFNCSPDSFLVEYFRRLADRAGKPYQILQLDEHDSTVGYGTRVESAVRAFRNHHRLQRLGSSFVKSGHLPVVPKIEKSLEGKTLLFPNWDTMAGPLLAANLRGYGIDARLLEEDETTIRRSMRLNTGQCIPMNVITQEFVDYVKRHGLDPAHTVLWMIETYWACGVGMYPGYIKGMFEKIGGGFENAGVYIGPLSHIDISPKLAVRTYLAFLFDGMLRRMSTRLRPYEREIGSVDRAVEQSRGDFVRCFEENGDFETVVDQVVSRFESIPVRREERPKVAVFGDVYVRDNDVINQDLIRFIEDHGGEVVSTPYNEYVKIIAGAYFKRWIKERQYLQFIKNRSLLAVLEAVEKRYLNYFREFTVDSQFFNNKQTEKELGSFRIHLEQEGESFDNALKIFYLLKQFPDISLFVQTNPAFCCPSMVTEAMSGTIEEITGVPVVTITYDGTGSSRNDLIVPYLEEAAKRLAPGAGELSRAGQPIRRCSMPPRY